MSNTFNVVRTLCEEHRATFPLEKRLTQNGKVSNRDLNGDVFAELRKTRALRLREYSGIVFAELEILSYELTWLSTLHAE